MPAGVLTGFHGKLPAAGDFVMRGLPLGLVAFWDGWAARHLAQRSGWPEDGLRFRLASGGMTAAAVVISSADRVGRRFPLAGFVIAPSLPDPAELDPWCDAALAVLRRGQSKYLTADELDDVLQELLPPTGAGEGPAMQLWVAAQPAFACNPDEPGVVLDQLFSCSGSSNL